MTSRACGNPAIETFLNKGIFLSECRGKTEGLLSIIFPYFDNVTTNLKNILSANEKLPVSKFRYFGKYIIQLFGFCYVHVSGQQQTCLEG